MITLPCGYRFRSYTPSIPDRIGVHVFWCQRCSDWHFILDEALKVEKPRKPGAKRSLGDSELAKSIDMAMLKDRVAEDLASTWGSVSAEEIAERHGVSPKRVYEVGVDIGLFTARPEE